MEAVVPVSFGKNIKAQASIELVLLLAVVLLLVQTIILPSFTIAENSAKDVSNIAVARSEVQKIVNAIEIADSSGAGSKQTLHIAVPARTILNPSSLDIPEGECCRTDPGNGKCVLGVAGIENPDPAALVDCASCTGPIHCFSADGREIELPADYNAALSFSVFVFGEPPEACKYDYYGRLISGYDSTYSDYPRCTGIIPLKISSALRVVDPVISRMDLNSMNYYTAVVVKDPASGEVQVFFK